MTVTTKHARKLYRKTAIKTSFRAWVRFDVAAANLISPKLRRIRSGV